VIREDGRRSEQSGFWVRGGRKSGLGNAEKCT
jgi:hypothetical protein